MYQLSDFPARFVSKVKVASNGCWMWTGNNSRGYGRYYIGNKTKAYAHRWAYEHAVAPIPDGLVVDHLCNEVACVNPAHLEPVTQQENVLRSRGHAAINARKTHCIRGHELSGDNIPTRWADGARHCLACKRLRDRGLLRSVEEGTQ